MKIIIDTDAKNEIDDQYALAYAVLSGAFDIRGFTAVHFGKKGSMEASYEEILHVLNLMGRRNSFVVCRGADCALNDHRSPVESPAARFIIEEAMNNSGEELHVISIGAITNLASACLIEPGIQQRIKAVWLAGKAWPEGGLFFNNRNDIIAAQTVFDSDMDLTLVPSCGTAKKLKIFINDRKHIKGKGKIGDYLWELFMRRLGIPKAVYDVAAIAAVKSPEFCTWVTSPRPALLQNGKYDHSRTKGSIKVAININRESIKSDFFSALNNAD